VRRLENVVARHESEVSVKLLRQTQEERDNLRREVYDLTQQNIALRGDY
jgi:hypothetical protein